MVEGITLLTADPVNCPISRPYPKSLTLRLRPGLGAESRQGADQLAGNLLGGGLLDNRTRIR